MQILKSKFVGNRVVDGKVVGYYIYVWAGKHDEDKPTLGVAEGSEYFSYDNLGYSMMGSDGWHDL